MEEAFNPQHTKFHSCRKFVPAFKLYRPQKEYHNRRCSEQQQQHKAILTSEAHSRQRYKIV